MRSSWTKCHKRDSPCASYQDHARRRIQASRNIHPGYNLIPIVFKLTRTSYFQTTWWLQHLPARCAMTRGALEHRPSQMWQKRFQQHYILLEEGEKKVFKSRRKFVNDAWPASRARPRWAPRTSTPSPSLTSRWTPLYLCAILKPLYSAQCVLCKVYFSAQPNKLRPVLKFRKYFPVEHIFVPACSSVRKIHFFKF